MTAVGRKFGIEMRLNLPLREFSSLGSLLNVSVKATPCNIARDTGCGEMVVNCFPVLGYPN